MTMAQHTSFFILLVVCCTALWSASASECRGEEDGREGGFGSLGYPHPYANNMNCTWIINVRSGKTIKLMFQSPFDLEAGYDFLKIYEDSPDGNRTETRSMTGDKTPPNYTSSTSRLEVTMTTDGKGSGRGFSLKWIQSNSGTVGQLSLFAILSLILVMAGLYL